MVADKKRLIKARAAKAARFIRDGFGKKSQISESWRKPRGLHSKKRRQKKAKGPLPTPGYGSPRAVKGLHPCGLREVRVFNPAGVEGLDPTVYAVRIAATVGGRKRVAIQERALETGIRVLNRREVKTALSKTPAGEES